jgi:hypothetical protein
MTWLFIAMRVALQFRFYKELKVDNSQDFEYLLSCFQSLHHMGCKTLLLASPLTPQHDTNMGNHK